MPFIIDSGFRVTSALPADWKSIWATTASLYSSSIYPGGYISSSWRYDGMTVYCQDNLSEYKLIGGVDDSNWVKITDGKSYISASYAPGSPSLSASYAFSASYAPGSPSISASYADTASFSYGALSASYAPGSPSISASYADTASVTLYSDFSGTASVASFAEFSDSASTALYADFSGTSSYVAFIISASHAIFADSASWTLNAGNSISASWASSSISASHSNLSDSSSYYPPFPTITNVDSASFASSSISASYVPNLYPQTEQISASWASSSISSSHSVLADSASYYPSFPTNIDSASFASSSISSSYANTASYALNVPITASNADTASYTFYAISASYAESASYVPNLYPQTEQVSSSWASSSISSSHSNLADSASYYPSYPTNIDSASFASSSISSSYTLSASYAPSSISLSGSLNYVPLWTPGGLTATSSIIDNNGKVGIGGPSGATQVAIFGAVTVDGSEVGGFYGETNLALNKPITQSTTLFGGAEAIYANDGVFNTYNHTSGGSGEWIRIDLGSVKPIGKIIIKKVAGYTDRPHTFKIQSAEDNGFTTGVTDIITVTGDASEILTLDATNFSAFYAQYIRILCINTNQYIELREWEIYDYTSSINTLTSTFKGPVSLGTINGPVIIGTLDGILQASSGIVSAISTATLSSSWASSSISASFADSSSYALSASWAPGGSGTTLNTGSTYPITSSWAESASYAPGSTGTTLNTGSTYPITASWAESASYAPGGTGTVSYTDAELYLFTRFFN